jgi:streptogramin lyase
MFPFSDVHKEASPVTSVIVWSTVPNLTMKCPRGITIDKKGQVLTSEFTKNKIHVINSEGAKSHVAM